MLGRTHRAAGLATGAAIAYFTDMGYTAAAITTVGAVLGSLLPDIDHKNSTISRRAKPVGVAIDFFVVRRNLFHDFKIYLILFILAFHMLHPYLAFWSPVFLGIATHLLLDALNPEGIPLFGKRRLHIASFKTGGIFDLILGILLGVCGIAFVVLYIQSNLQR